MRSVGCIEPERTSPLDKPIILAVLALFLTGCPAPTTTEVTETIEKSDTTTDAQSLQLAEGQGVIILEAPGNRVEDADCVREKIQALTPKLRIAPTKALSDSVVSEIRIARSAIDAEQFAEAISQSDVSDQLAALDISYVIIVDRTSVPSGGFNPAASGGRRGLAAGVGSANVRTSIEARLWEVAQGTLAGTLTSVSHGTQTLFFPLMFHPYTESAACAALAGRIASLFARKAAK